LANIRRAERKGNGLRRRRVGGALYEIHNEGIDQRPLVGLAPAWPIRALDSKSRVAFDATARLHDPVHAPEKSDSQITAYEDVGRLVLAAAHNHTVTQDNRHASLLRSFGVSSGLAR
jgi:hypothetical protein